MIRWKEKGQAMAAFALFMSVLILLMFGLTFAAFYAFRSASTDWGVFITGVAGSHNDPNDNYNCRGGTGHKEITGHERKRQSSSGEILPLAVQNIPASLMARPMPMRDHLLGSA